MKVQRGKDKYFINKKTLEELRQKGSIIVLAGTILLSSLTTSAKAERVEKLTNDNSSLITQTSDEITTSELDTLAVKVPKEILKIIFPDDYKNITYGDLLPITDLNINFYYTNKIQEIDNLDFIKYFPNLNSILLGNVKINDISALKNSKIKEFTGINITISNEDLQNLPSNLRELDLSNCYFITNLEDLPTIAPNLEKITLSRLPSLKSLDFVKELYCLKYVNFEQLAIIYPELKEFLDKQNIKNNLIDEDIMRTANVDKIISSIITEDMNDDEKIAAITYYVVDNIKYEKKLIDESNENPLSTSLSGAGVCATYAYFMSTLLQKAGIESYEISNNGHAWTIVQKEGKYYYIDSTNLIQDTNFLKKILEKYHVGYAYMQDPAATAISAMDDYDSEDVLISDELVQKILNGEANKSIIEKNFSNYPIDILEILGLGVALKIIADLIPTKTRKKKR